jgi:hypothetical protein
VLTVARLLTVALPPILLGTPLFVTHGFHQLVAGALCIAIAAWLVADARLTPSTFALRATVDKSRYELLAKPSRADVRAFRGVILFVLLLAVLVRPAAAAIDVLTEQLRHVLPHIGSIRGGYDVQGAFAIAPGYELALLAGLIAASRVAVTVRRGAAALVLLTVAQIVMLVAAGEMTAHAQVDIPLVAVRGLAVMTPILLFVLTFHPVVRWPVIEARPSAYRRRSAV